MILVRSPLRITLGGGGSDLPGYARKFGGFALVGAIDKFVYVGVMKPFEPGIRLKYSEQENVSRVADVHHPLIREALSLLQIPEQIEITALADIPASTGLGSSSSFTTALIKALSLHEHRNNIPPAELAELACDIEIRRLCAPIGKQDQYAAAYGGVTALEFLKNGNVIATPLALSADTIAQLEDGLLLYFTGYSRSASDILADQQQRLATGDPAAIERLGRTKARGEIARDYLLGGELVYFGELLHQHWLEKQRQAGMSNTRIDAWYELAREHGAFGGKLVGAGGGGFLLLYTEDPRRLRKGLKDSGLQEVRFRFEWEGTKTLILA